MKIKAEGAELYRQLAQLLEAGKPPGSTEAMDAAELHRQYITRWFYNCSRVVHRGLGQLYVDDPRFAANIDRFAPGLAGYCREAFAANAARR